MINYYLIKIKHIFINNLKLIYIVFATIVLLFLSLTFGKRFFNGKYLMAHGLGSINIDNKNYIYTNTLDAFNKSYKKWFRNFEVDFTLTNDNKVVAFHGYSKGIYSKLGIQVQNFSYNSFMSGEVFSKSYINGLKPLDMSDIINLISEYSNTQWFFHFHANSDKNLGYYFMDELMNNINVDDKLLKRIYIGINYKDELDVLDKYNFINKSFNVYTKSKRDEEIKDQDKLIDYLLSNNIKRVSIESKVYFDEYDLIKKIKKSNIEIVVFTENDLFKQIYLVFTGADKIKTDNLK